MPSSLKGATQFERESVVGPVFVDDGCDFGLHEGADLLDDCDLVGLQAFRNAVEIAIGGWKRFLFQDSRHVDLRFLFRLDIGALRIRRPGTR